MSTDKAKQQQLIALIHRIISEDAALREQYQVGDKFKFIRERLRKLLEDLENDLNLGQMVDQKTTFTIAPDEILVYVYLYNSQGLTFRSWQNMLTPTVFYEYSVNRPIYADKKAIEELIRVKTHKAHHAYLTVAMKQIDVLTSGDGSLKDALGNPQIKIKEGALRFEKLVSFTHNGQVYSLTQQGELVKSAL